MFRSVLTRSLASVPRAAVRTPQLSSSFIRYPQSAPSLASAVRLYSAPAGLAKPEVEGRIFDILKNFDKVRFSVLIACLSKLLSCL